MATKEKFCIYGIIIVLLTIAFCLYLASWMLWNYDRVEIFKGTKVITNTYGVPASDTKANVTMSKGIEKNWKNENQTEKKADEEVVTETSSNEQCENLELTKSLIARDFLGCVKNMNISLHKNLDGVKQYMSYFENCKMLPVCGGLCYIIHSKTAWNILGTEIGNYEIGKQKLCDKVEMTKSMNVTGPMQCMKEMSISQDKLHDFDLLNETFFENCDIEPMFCGKCYNIYAKYKDLQ